MSAKPRLRLPAASFLLLGVCASGSVSADGLLDVSIEPHLFSSELVSSHDNAPQEARVSSGLELALSNPLLQVSMDYNVQSQVKETEQIQAHAVTQLLDASVQSSALNRILGLDASINAVSKVNTTVDSYRHKVTPGLSTSLNRYADLKLQYEYTLDKASAEATQQERKGLFLGLAGSLQDGRFTWSGNYRSSSVYEDGLMQTESSEQINFTSQLQIVPHMQLELSSGVTYQTDFSGNENEEYAEKRYGAGIAWTPSETYSLAFRVKKLNESRYGEQELLRSGSLSWTPRRDLEFSLNYGDQLVEGERGVMLETRFMLDRS